MKWINIMQLRYFNNFLMYRKYCRSFYDGISKKSGCHRIVIRIVRGKIKKVNILIYQYI